MLLSEDYTVTFYQQDALVCLLIGLLLISGYFIVACAHRWDTGRRWHVV